MEAGNGFPGLPFVNAALDVAPWRERLQREGRVQIDDYLEPEAAERLHRCLQYEVPWSLSLRDSEGVRVVGHAEYAAMSIEARADLVAATAAGDGFRFAYDKFDMVESGQGRGPVELLGESLEFFNSSGYIDFARQLAGDDRICSVVAKATRYRAGHFLRRHSDGLPEQVRLYAYVLNLARDWQADWGGLLQFIGSDGRVLETFLPRWNTLSLFAVPAWHAVSQIAPWARQDRLSITGWWLTCNTDQEAG